VRRRSCLLGAAALAALARPAWSGDADDSAVRRGRALRFPRDHGAHLGATIEWWYVTGWLGSEAAPTHGFQITFFRSRTGLAEGNASRFAARHLLFAHAAVTDLARGSHHHAGQLARWSGDPAAAWAGASLGDADVRLAGWSLRRDGEAYLARLQARPFDIDLRLDRRQPLLLQGDAGFSRKGPEEAQASHYYSEPQLGVAGSALAGPGSTTSGVTSCCIPRPWAGTGSASTCSTAAR
jgi:predicted secreted hydrolase